MATLRVATVADTAALTHIVRCSPAYVGRYQAQAERVAFGAEYLDEHHVQVAVDDAGRVIGFYSFSVPGLLGGVEDAELDFLFVDGACQRCGIGRVLLRDALAAARAMRLSRVVVVAHPPSRGFYERLGGEYLGERPPAGVVTWSRPIYLFRLR